MLTATLWWKSSSIVSRAELSSMCPRIISPRLPNSLDSAFISRAVSDVLLTKSWSHTGLIITLTGKQCWDSLHVRYYSNNNVYSLSRQPFRRDCRAVATPDSATTFRRWRNPSRLGSASGDALRRRRSTAMRPADIITLATCSGASDDV